MPKGRFGQFNPVERFKCARRSHALEYRKKPSRSLTEIAMLKSEFVPFQIRLSRRSPPRILNFVTDSIHENIQRVRERISRACVRAGRQPHEVALLAVTKTHTPDHVSRAIVAGVTDIGESKIQELESKIDLFDRSRVRVHLIGHLQTNKAKKAAMLCDVIQSVDTIRLARELDRHASERKAPLECLIQINCSGETQKSGVDPAEAVQLMRDVHALEYLALTGVMTIGPLTDDQSAIRRAFQLCKSFFEEGRSIIGSKFCWLSMGMTDDYELAIEEGSTMVRIGSALFGARDYSSQSG